MLSPCPLIVSLCVPSFTLCFHVTRKHQKLLDIVFLLFALKKGNISLLHALMLFKDVMNIFFSDTLGSPTAIQQEIFEVFKATSTFHRQQYFSGIQMHNGKVCHWIFGQIQWKN